MPEIIRVAAVDDFPIFVAGIRSALRHCEEIDFVGEGATSQDALRIARELRPDVMLLDIKMPGDGLRAAQAITAARLPVKVIILTASANEEKVHQCLAAGALGYVLKGAGADELISAIRAVNAGEPYITHALASRLLISQEQRDRTGSLSPREEQILSLAATGLANDEIAEHLGLAISTVKNAMSRILEKMNVRNRTEATSHWLRGKSEGQDPSAQPHTKAEG